MGAPSLRVLTNERDAALDGVDITIVSLPPGTRTVPVAHSASNIFAFVLAAPEEIVNARCFLHGETYIVNTNDCVGFRAGTGIGCAFINEADSQLPVDILVFAETKPDDEVYYPFLEPSTTLVRHQSTLSPQAYHPFRSRPGPTRRNLLEDHITDSQRSISNATLTLPPLLPLHQSTGHLLSSIAWSCKSHPASHPPTQSKQPIYPSSPGSPGDSASVALFCLPDLGPQLHTPTR